MGKHFVGRINPRGLWPKGTRREEYAALFRDTLLGEGRREWFFSYVRKVGKCEEWMGARDRKGYGSVGIAGIRSPAHRVAFVIHYGRDPGELQVCHECDNPPCTKKSHLFLGTQADNNRDAKEKGRLRPVRGERAPNAKLTDAKVREIRRLKSRGWGDRRIARRMGVSRSTIRFVSLGITWKHVS